MNQITSGHGSAFHASDDDIVTIVGDGCHCADATQSESGAGGRVDLATDGTE